MLAHTHRLSTAAFSVVYESGKRVSTPLFLFIYTKNSMGDKRYAVAVPKKVVTRAVQRNMIRRRIFAGISDVLESSPAISCIVIPRQRITTYDPKEITQKTHAALEEFYEEIT